MKRKATEWEKVFAKHTAKKGLRFIIHKECLKSIKKMPDNLTGKSPAQADDANMLRPEKDN